MKWKWIGFIVLLIAVALSVAFLVVKSSGEDEKKGKPEIPVSSVPKEENKTTIDTIKDGPNDVDIPEKAIVHVIEGGWLSLESDSELTVSTGDIKEGLPKPTLFVLVPDTLTLDEEDEKRLREYIEQKRTVLFYGKNVDAKQVLAHLGIDDEPIALESNADLNNFLYGYGYSQEYGAFMHVFSPSNTSEEEVLREYVARFVFNKRGY